MRLNIWRVIAFLLLIALSVGFGFGYDAVATSIERRNYPTPASLAPSIEKYAAEYGIPEHILWATVRNGSHFASNAVSDDGEVGLMQLTPTQFDFIQTQLLGQEPMDAGMLYDPETNLQCGTAWLSYLYEHYGIWELVYAAYHAGTETVDAWLADKDLVDEAGVLKKIPDSKIAAYVKESEKAADYYRKLYYKS